ncbi:MAG TPA: C1 family peptidase [Bacteroidales bacterium]|nr:C1 family peptidase [Bacteroidales bacterium]HNT94454.1 C1 family peptidase [Bacteroidales bacterium]HOO67460.1 C1 family peptidase [Bacteroidales bacterium]HPE23541.1 C1 family peptidase [Bacteroidales bacterium]HPJ05691.1 C1 family peptidase [Bacteroidales bacterium]
MPLQAQKAKKQAAAEPEGFKFTTVVSNPASPVKNQSATGTCWCFATTSFMESELLRMGKGEYDLSEMFIVRKTYENRILDNYLRLGKGNLGEGSLSPSWLRVFREDGIVPQEAYTGISYDSPVHNHRELQSYIDAVTAVPVKMKRLSKESNEVTGAILDIYLGEVPETFNYKGQSYTPKSFAASLGLNMDDYVHITSFSHFPFYTEGLLEVPDNWEMNRFHNVPVDELIQIMDFALTNGYTVNWDGDVSERGFSHASGVAINPDMSKMEIPANTDRARFEGMPSDRTPIPGMFDRPQPEIEVTQEIRQKGYETFVTSDDHLMHVTGIVKDQNGNKYYITKNSWGTDRNPHGGYLNMSESYVRAKTIFIMVHKDAVPADIKAKLKI